MVARNKIIAAVRSSDELEKALISDTKIVFDLSPNILTLDESIKILHSAGKKYFVHMDLAEGIGKDKSGIIYLKSKGVDGIISTRTSIIKLAREVGLFTVQRFFILIKRHMKYGQ